MANYTDLNAGDPILAEDLNALSDDTIDPTSGHVHDGTEGRSTLGSGATSISMDGRLLWDKGADIASGATITPGADGNYFDITGTVTITAIATLQAGAIVIFQFDGALQLTHNATSLILQDAANYTTETGDVLAFISEGSGNWRELFRRLVSPTAAHTVASHSDTSGTGAELNTLTDGSSGVTLHTHAANPAQATQTALETEANEDTYAPPDLLKHSPGVAKVSCNINAAGALQTPDHGVSTVTDTGTGDRTINFTTAFSSSVFVPNSTPLVVNTDVAAFHASLATGSVRLVVQTSTGGSALDHPTATIIMGDL